MSEVSQEYAIPETEDTAAEEVTTEPAAEDKQVELKVGYVVGLSKDGNFVFQVHGEQPGLLEILGLHDLAKDRIKRLYEANQGGGDSLVMELGKLVVALDRKVTAVLETIAPTKPDNQL